MPQGVFFPLSRLATRSTIRVEVCDIEREDYELFVGERGRVMVYFYDLTDEELRTVRIQSKPATEHCPITAARD